MDSSIHTDIYRCLLCNNISDSNEGLMNHLKCHNSYKPFFCAMCDKRYVSKANLKKHELTHSAETNTLYCQDCDYKCSNRRNFFHHQEAHAMDKSYTCDKCHFITKCNFSLSKHKQVEKHNVKYSCKECDLSFGFISTFTKHQKEIHKINKPFTCQLCSLQYSNNSNYIKHLKKHEYNKMNEQVESSCYDNFLDMSGETNDQNNNIKDSQSNHADNVEYNQVPNTNEYEMPIQCVSCQKVVRYEKKGGKRKINKRYSSKLNSYLCKLASSQWGKNWEYKDHKRICITCRLKLVNGKPMIPEKTIGRPEKFKVKYSKKKNLKSTVVINEIDLNLQQSVSHLSSRQMHKQKLILKSSLKNQGFKVKMANEKKVAQLRKQRLDDLYENKEVWANVGTEKSPISKQINVVYCKDICELAKRIAIYRNTELDTCKLQGDHGQGSLKLSIQFTFSNSVTSLIILAITEESKESILTLKTLELLVNPQSLEKNLGIKLLRTGDLQYLQLSIGIKTGNATFPCPFCYWRMTGDNRDAVDTVCPPRNICNDLEKFLQLGSKRELSNLCHGQQGEPAFVGSPTDVFVPPCLHIMLGLVNHLLNKMEKKHGESYVKEELYDLVKVKKAPYQGGTFAGNEIQKIINTFNSVSWEEHPFKDYSSLFYALQTTNSIVFSIRTNLSEDDIFEIALSIREVLHQWSSLKELLGLSENTVKLHVFAVHCLEFVIKNQCTPSSYGEQDGEMLHRRFKEALLPYKPLVKKAILHTVKLWNSWNF